jgi:hypothetical protein
MKLKTTDMINNRQYTLLEQKDLVNVNGGSEFSEAVFRLFGYLSVKVEEAWENWKENSDKAIRAMPY